MEGCVNGALDSRRRIVQAWERTCSPSSCFLTPAAPKVQPGSETKKSVVVREKQLAGWNGHEDDEEKNELRSGYSRQLSPAAPLLTTAFCTLTNNAVLCVLCAVVRLGRTPYWVWMSSIVTYFKELHLMFCHVRGEASGEAQSI
jgi:hypothetical protein